MFNEAAKKCDFCAESIPVCARRCPYCGSLLKIDRPDSKMGKEENNGADYDCEGLLSKEENNGTNSGGEGLLRTESAVCNAALPAAMQTAPATPSTGRRNKFLSNGIKVCLTVISTIVPGLGQLAGIIIAIVLINDEGDADRRSFGSALLVASLCFFVIWLILWFIAIVAMIAAQK